MKKNVKNEGLQSRREFFKKAAKGALPILGALVLSQIPSIAQAVEESPSGCKGCSTGCYSSCIGGCSNTCKGHCQFNCQNSCHANCTGANRSKW